MAQAVKDLVRGASDPNTVQTYSTKGFSNEGVKGSTPVDRLTENSGAGITPDVMKMQPAPPVQKVVKDTVVGKGQGEGMPEDSGKVKK